MNVASLNKEAERYIPGGVSSSTRKHPGGLFVERAEGASFWDQDGKRYLDYDCAGGSVILGYQHRSVQGKIADAIGTQLYYGVGATEPEVALAEKLCAHVPCIEKVQLCNGSTDALFHAIRLARAVTRRGKVIRLQGAYHGWHDYVLANDDLTVHDEAGANADKLRPSVGRLGVLPEAAGQTVVCRINDLNEIRAACQQYKGDIAAIVCDPCNAALGCIQLDADYVRGLRDICDAEGILLIFDETVSGFRVSLGGASATYDVMPDLVTLCGAMSGGYPAAAVGGRAELMARINTAGGDVSTQNTYYGNPVMASVCIAIIEELEQPGYYERLNALSDMLADGLRQAAQAQGFPFCEQHRGGLLGFWFGEGPIGCLDDVVNKTDAVCLQQFREAMLERGFFLPQGPCGSMKLTSAHTEDDIRATILAASEALAQCKGGRT